VLKEVKRFPLSSSVSLQQPGTAVPPAIAFCLLDAQSFQSEKSSSLSIVSRYARSSKPYEHLLCVLLPTVSEVFEVSPIVYYLQ